MQSFPRIFSERRRPFSEKSHALKDRTDKAELRLRETTTNVSGALKQRSHKATEKLKENIPKAQGGV